MSSPDVEIAADVNQDGTVTIVYGGRAVRLHAVLWLTIAEERAGCSSRLGGGVPITEYDAFAAYARRHSISAAARKWHVSTRTAFRVVAKYRQLLSDTEIEAES